MTCVISEYRVHNRGSELNPLVKGLFYIKRMINIEDLQKHLDYFRLEH